jgi:hypothetical protein
VTLATPIAALMLLLPPSAQAPPADPGASTLAVKRGERVIVTRTTATGTLSGRVLRLEDVGLVLGDKGASQTIPYRDLERIVRAKDSVWNGALIGYGAGFAAGAAVVAADSCHPQPGQLFDLCLDGPGFAVAFGGLITGPIGMAVGAITDALIKRPHVVFDRRGAPHTTISVVPTLTRGGAGFRAAITF